MKYVAYYRVSTQRQGKSGLGLEAQRHSVLECIEGGKLVAEFTEVESGKKNERPELEKAFAACRAYKAKLVIAKLDRLSRDACFLLGLEKAGVDFMAADMPNANRLTVGVMALVAEDEGRKISIRTKEALAAAKRRGVKLGGYRGGYFPKVNRMKGVRTTIEKSRQRAEDVLPIIAKLQEGGVYKLEHLAACLNDAGVPTPRGKTWHAMTVKRAMSYV